MEENMHSTQNQLKFLQKFIKLATDDSTKDITFDVTGTKIKAHKFMLKMVSPVFEKILHGKDEIKILNTRPEIFRMVIDAIYMKQISLSSTNDAFELYTAGTMFCLKDVKEIAKHYLYENCNHINWIDVYEMAQEMGQFEVQVQCKELFKENPDKILISTLFLNKEMSEDTFLMITDRYVGSHENLLHMVEFLVETGKLISYERILKELHFLKMSVKMINLSVILTKNQKLALVANKDALKRGYKCDIPMPKNFKTDHVVLGSREVSPVYLLMTFILSPVEFAEISLKRLTNINCIKETDMTALQNILTSKKNGKGLCYKDFEILFKYLWNCCTAGFTVNCVDKKHVEFINSDTKEVFHTIELE